MNDYFAIDKYKLIIKLASPQNLRACLWQERNKVNQLIFSTPFVNYGLEKA
jgi:hypothetical protein